jgi:hypothetical protein
MESAAMIIPTSNADCLLRPLREGDQEDIVLHGNNRKIWRNLTHIFPHPYTLADADQWVVSSNSDPRSLHLAIELQGQPLRWQRASSRSRSVRKPTDR